MKIKMRKWKNNLFIANNYYTENNWGKHTVTEDLGPTTENIKT